jgi:phosphopantothenoylcysteine decarboxylase/phosphopantothenate--cysteine ligase
MQESIAALRGKRIILGVTGSIACYKAVDLASKLTQAGAQVDVIMTDAAQRFVTPLTFQAVTGRAVYTDLWRAETGGGLPTHIAHVGLAEGADVLAVMPATADSLARLAHGRADDLLCVTALAARCPLLLAPAMDGAMYSHAAVQANVALLKSRGATLVEPEYGRFASGFEGQGRLPETPTLMGALRLVLGRSGALAGKTVMVTAGGTREPLDPVRYLTNRSSGRQGYALAQAALDAGARVILVSSAKGLPIPYGATLLPVETAREMKDSVLGGVSEVDVLLMAAAVADFRPRTAAAHKIKKTELSTDAPMLELERTDDILAAVKAARKPSSNPRLVVGFAAESQDLLLYAQDKMQRKGVDLLVANDISASDAGFDVETNRVLLLSPDGTQEAMPLMSKAQVSEAIIRRVAALLG